MQKTPKDINNKQGYKKTKLGWVPEDWEVGKIGALTNKVGSGSTPRGGSEVYTECGIPFIRSQNVNFNQLILDDISYIPPEMHFQMKGTTVLSNDILLNITGASIGRSCVVPKEFKEGNVNQHVCIIRLKKGTNSKFVQLFLSSYDGQKAVLRTQVGGNREGLNHSSVRSVQIPLPPLPEQQKIATILSKWDEAVTLTQELITKKQKQKKALMQQLLAGKKRLKGFSGKWTEIRIEDLFNRVTEKNKANHQNVLTISAQHGLVSQSEFYNKNVSGVSILGYYLIQNGDFAYNKSTSNGYPMGALKRLTKYDIGVVSTLYICFRPKSKEVVSDYFEHFFESGLMNRSLRGIAQEGARSHGLLNMSVHDFFRLKFNVPSVSEQLVIAKVLNTANTELTELKNKLQQLQQQKKGLMQELLTGKTRVQL